MASVPGIPVSALRDPVVFLATGCGAGLLRPAPGTWGTLAALPLAYGLSLLPLPVSALLIGVAALGGIWLCGLAGDRLGVKDHGGIVWDEWVGLWIALAAFPFDWITVVVGFSAFRLFDIVKPWPVSWADSQLEGGLGVMLDDVIAGVFAAVVVLLVRVSAPL